MRGGGDLRAVAAGREAAGVDAVIFDLFGVLFRWPGPRGKQRLRALAGIAEPDFAALYWRHRPGYDRGELDSAAYWRRVGAGAGRGYDAGQVAGLVRADAAMWSRPSRIMVRALLALHAAGVRTAILSNVPADIWGHLAGQHPWLRVPDAATLSFRAGAVKPEPAIYQRCLADLGVAAARALFVDDRRENVAAAGQLGMSTRRLTPHGQLVTAAYLLTRARRAGRARQNGEAA